MSKPNHGKCFRSVVTLRGRCNYLVKFGDFQVSLFVVGAEFGEIQVSLFVAAAVFGEIWKDSRSAKCCIFQWKVLAASSKVTSVARRVAD